VFIYGYIRTRKPKINQESIDELIEESIDGQIDGTEDDDDDDTITAVMNKDTLNNNNDLLSNLKADKQEIRNILIRRSKPSSSVLNISGLFQTRSLE
jgi:hypothetical protein